MEGISIVSFVDSIREESSCKAAVSLEEEDWVPVEHAVKEKQIKSVKNAHRKCFMLMLLNHSNYINFVQIKDSTLYISRQW